MLTQPTRQYKNDTRPDDRSVAGFLATTPRKDLAALVPRRWLSVDADAMGKRRIGVTKDHLAALLPLAAVASAMRQPNVSDVVSVNITRLHEAEQLMTSFLCRSVKLMQPCSGAGRFVHTRNSATSLPACLNYRRRRCATSWLPLALLCGM